MSERRTLQELVGISVNSSSLRIESRSQGGETSLLRVAALGAAVLNVQHGADRLGPRGRGGPLVEALTRPQHAPKAIDQVCGELAGVLYHLRFGGQHELLRQAVTLFAAYIAMRTRFGPQGFLGAMTPQERAALIERFAARALHEWLSDRCIACGGSGKLERAISGSWVRPRGNMKRNAVYRTCTSCHGSRQAVPSHTSRRMAMGIDIKQYEEQGWAQHFKAAFTWLGGDVGRLTRPLTAELERRKRRT